MKSKILLPLLLLCTQAFAQLNPGFDPTEYGALLQIASLSMDSTDGKSTEYQDRQFTCLYQSPVMGLANKWEYWLDEQNNVGVIHLRGTTAEPTSWLANFYAAQVPATGKLAMAEGDTFAYHLADNPAAAVHVGWLYSSAWLLRDIIPYLANNVQGNTSHIIVFGHSQGGALAYLVRAYLENNEQLADFKYKAYHSAAPKIGNTYFAYHYDYITRGGWALRVINELDWVPEVPFSAQTLDDFNPSNPFKGVVESSKKMPLLQGAYVRKAYKQMDKRTRASAAVFEKYLGNMSYNLVKKVHPEFPQPTYSHGNNYMPAGTPIIFMQNADYNEAFNDPSNTRTFLHHMPRAYLFQLQQYNPSPEQ